MCAVANRDLVLSVPGVVSAEDLRAELAAKQERLSAFLESQQLDAVLLRRSENIAWATAGLVEMRVAIPSETQVGSLLIRRDGKRFYLAPSNEAARLGAEEFAALDFEPVIFPWYDNRTLAEAARLTGGALGSDSPAAGLKHVNLLELRASLTGSEAARYRWLAEHTAAVTADVLEQLEPGVTEHEMEALIADGLLVEGILPSVLLMATDERIVTFKHAVARNGVLERFGMLNLCARKWGLAVSITRFVHFGALPAELARNFAAAAEVNAALWHATRAGATSAQLFAVARDAYAQAGFPGEEQMHHQGGAAGYVEREWVATPSGAETVVDSQAFAWNPSIRGGKVEDTVLLKDGAIEVLTATPGLPIVETTVGDTTYRTAGVLIRE